MLLVMILVMNQKEQKKLMMLHLYFQLLVNLLLFCLTLVYMYIPLLVRWYERKSVQAIIFIVFGIVVVDSLYRGYTKELSLAIITIIPLTVGALKALK